jgi:heme/copper-type cytochrome/quinol oxidase subunit 3
MLNQDKEEYIYRTKHTLRMTTIYSVTITLLFSLLYNYYYIKKQNIPDALVNINILILIIFSITIILQAEGIKKHSIKNNIDLKEIKDLKFLDKFLFLFLLASLTYTLFQIATKQKINYKIKLRLAISTILFGTLFLNYRFLYY